MWGGGWDPGSGLLYIPNNLKLFAVLCSNNKMPSYTSKSDFLEASPAGVAAT